MNIVKKILTEILTTMKKIILSFFLIILPFLSFAQINEGFEGATFPPTTPGNWAILDNGVGTGVSWATTTDPARVYAGTKSAICDRELLSSGQTSQDWLVTSQFTVPSNGQLRFWTRQTLSGNNGSTYEIRVSTNSTQNDQAAYTTVQTWTETSLNTTYNVYEEKLVSLSSYAGQPIYIAFVRINTQPSTSTTGDRWLLDDVKVVQQCLDPSVLTVGTITPTTASLSWTNNGSATAWEVEVIPASNTSTGTGVAASTNPFTITGLTPGTAYKYYVRSNCGGGNYSAWVGPFNFITTPAGSICSAPINISTLPYSNSGNTNNFGDEVDTFQGSSCGATPATTNYLQGPEVFYAYTPTVSGNITVSMTPTGATSSIFVYNGCSNVGSSCVAGVANSGSGVRTIPTLAVVAGQTYIFVVSTSSTTGVPYTLIIQDVNCMQPASLSANTITTSSANLSWSNPSGATSWQVAIQPAGSNIPSGAGVTAPTNTNYLATNLTAATAYQYWVRADCGGGLFSAWSGPYFFNTEVCDAAQKCNYTFRMTDDWGDGWNGARMEIRQNGVVVATIGSTFTSGAGPLDIIVPLCETLPFELYWTVAGSFPAEVGIEVINNFTQSLYKKAFASGSASTTTPLHSTTFDCDNPACLPPTALTATAITTTGATLGWNAGGATSWDIYVVLNGSPAPTATTTPTYSSITTNPFVVTGLNPNTTYQYYIRTVCNATTTSIWAATSSFTTLPTCSTPITQTVTGMTPYTATLGWTQPANPAGGFATTWEIFVLPCGSAAPTATSTGAIVTTQNPYTASGLTPLSCYDFYVRAICSSTDSSNWAGPKTFNTPDTNDECINAKLAPINQNTNCLQTVTGTVAGATPSSQTNVGTGCSNTADDDDVWFRFVATASTHYISLLGVNYSANPTNLNFALYTGNCSAMTQIGACVTGTNTRSHIRNGLIPGQTYYVRVYSTGTNASITTFDLCIGTNVITCPSALPLCAINPIILPNNVGVPTLPNPVSPYSTTSMSVGCLGSAPAPTFYYLTIPISGNYTFFLEQNTNNTFTGTGIDVDYASWGPYANTTAACSGITTSNVRTGLTVGCSFSAAFTETFSINGAVAGQVYVLMVTNYSQRKGFIRITQTSGPIPLDCCPYTNFSYPGSYFCKDGANIFPTLQSGGTAGTFASTAGLVIDPVTGEINIAASIAGSYTVTNTILAANTCTTSISSWSITISEPAIATIAYPNGSAYCTTITTVQNATQTGTTGGTYFATPNGLSINTSTGAITPNTSLPNNYTVNYVISTIPGCPTFVATANVIVSLAPTATIASSDADNTICSDETATITVTPTNYTTGATYTWTRDGNPISGTSNTINPTETGTYVATVTLNGCTNVVPLSLLFTINPKPEILLDGECEGANYILTSKPDGISFNPAVVTYEWFANNTAIPSSNDATFNVTEYITANSISYDSFPITFSVEVTSPNGCVDIQTFTVETPFCTIPKGISPNGDGKNDYFDLRGLGVKQLTIFNRYGAKIFSQANYTNEWRGQNSKSENSPVGTYYYVIELNNGETKTGWIYLNR